MITRREWLRTTAAMAALGVPLRGWLTTTGDTVVVYKSASCGCCKAWVQHMTANGFTLNVHDVDDVAVYKKKYGVSDKLASCHTALVSGYVLEGHVPAADVKRLLKQKPAAVLGLAVPGMPAGSPGMEGAHTDKYDVLLFDDSGKTTVFSSH